MNLMCDEITFFAKNKSHEEKTIKEFADLLAAFYIIAKQTIDMIMHHKAHGRKINAWALDSAKTLEQELAYESETKNLRAKARELGREAVIKKVYMQT